jgi:tetratricopeptide (TPR) repeat protein
MKTTARKAAKPQRREGESSTEKVARRVPAIWIAWDAVEAKEAKNKGAERLRQQAYELLGNGAFDAALLACNQALELDSDYALAHGTRALALTELGRHSEALDAARRGVQLDNNSAGVQFCYANALLWNDLCDEAISACERGIELDSRMESLFRNLGADANAGAGRFNKSLEWLSRSLTCVFGKIESINEVSSRLDQLSRALALTIQDKYNSYIMAGGLQNLNDVAARLGFAFADAKEILEAAAKAARETTGRATAAPRLKWKLDAGHDENPAAFAWRAYAVEAAAGTLHLGVIRQEDEPLAVKLVSWLRSPANRKQVPEGFDIPTLPEWNTRQIEAGKAKPAAAPRPRTEGNRLYSALRRRRAAASVDA